MFKVHPASHFLHHLMLVPSLYDVVIVNVEMLVVEELYKEAVVNTSRKLIVFNGELDRIRSGCILYTDMHVIELCHSDLCYLDSGMMLDTGTCPSVECN